MPNTILWIDRENAKLFNMDAGKLTTQHLHAHDPDHHTHVKMQSDHESARFYKNVYEHIKDRKDLVVMGPGLGKKHFLGYLETHHPVFQKQNIKTYVTVDHPTDAQILEYFKE